MLVTLLLLGVHGQDEQFDDDAPETKSEFDEKVYACIVLARQQLSFYGSDELVRIVKK